ncbi:MULTISPECIES: MarR family transcriptional regulator [Actinomadura]|uniref:DNA-binding transcriptional regulator, MarR family n=2 Tax=Actinomadura madurae TaxID=1993 RepID=A0A1I5XID6_9ACTN|nr:MarR family transcriptional regulator [Actinomadura madurae]MCP9953235.1 MarR family transcriptional regulator [Actinomadura madurae]MCP9969998.1 MarR family transcriptional regulator [Actinomadura madurae]MCQ0006015.1 MarR family transcriptional regulator [Actinomadura madurae]MCQ0018699.1 MarR family transcriptional regulator [Actinomadura madurae]URM98704.1 MarR family transcriptional regulator [Actinomadura madurae]
MTTPPIRGRTASAPGLAEELRISIARLSRRLRTLRPSAAGGGPSPLSLTQFAALAAIERHGSMTPRELADHEKVQPPSMTRVIAHLEERGLVARSPHPTDGRQVVLSATEEGAALLADERRRKEAWLAKRLGELTDAEREILRRAAPIIDKLSRS